jgi:hypothetical protein
MKKLAKPPLRVSLSLLGTDQVFLSLRGGERLHQFRHGVMGSLPVSVESPTLVEMIESGLG